MNKHLIIAPVLFVGATALLLFSMSLPADDQCIAHPETCQTVSNPSPLPTSGNPSSTPAPGKSGKPVPSGNPASPAPVKSASPSPKPSGSPCPPAPSAAPDESGAAPNPSASANPCAPLPSFGIAATTPDAVLREARIQAGRVDPFKTVFAPDLPEFTPAVAPEQLALPSLPPLPQSSGGPPIQHPTAAPDRPVLIQETALPPRPGLKEGLSLKGIMDGGVDPIAIIEVRGVTELVRVGERLSGGILITSINFDERQVTLSRGSESGTLTIDEPKSPSY